MKANTPDQSAPVPATPTLMRRTGESVIGLLSGALLGGIGGAVAFALVGTALMLISSGHVEEIIAILWSVVGAAFGGVCGAFYGMLHGAFVGAIWRRFGGAKAYSPRSVVIKWVIRGVGFGMVLVVAVYVWWDQAASPPTPAEVESMTAVLESAKREQVTFSVPADHIAKVLAALTPARRDWSPKKWEKWGQLKITCKDGRTMKIDLYRTRGASGAFSVHPDDRKRNSGFVSNYFRGGADETIAHAVQNAHESSKLR